jgi:two-component system chemotaxis response regulator CheV
MGGAMMVTEYSKRTLGFLVHEVDRIIRVDWDKVRAPESWSPDQHADFHHGHHRTADDGRLVSILDVERSWPGHLRRGAVVGQIDGAGGNDEHQRVLRRRFGGGAQEDRRGARQARHQAQACAPTAWRPGPALRHGGHAQQTGQPLTDEIDLILVDAEMPEMDGYVLTRHIKSDPRFAGIPVVMHSSLSSEANRAMGKSVGVDAYVAKFDAEVLADTLRPCCMRAQSAENG